MFFDVLKQTLVFSLLIGFQTHTMKRVRKLILHVVCGCEDNSELFGNTRQFCLNILIRYSWLPLAELGLAKNYVVLSRACVYHVCVCVLYNRWSFVNVCMSAKCAICVCVCVCMGRVCARARRHCRCEYNASLIGPLYDVLYSSTNQSYSAIREERHPCVCECTMKTACVHLLVLFVAINICHRFDPHMLRALSVCDVCMRVCCSQWTTPMFISIRWVVWVSKSRVKATQSQTHIFLDFFVRLVSNWNALAIHTWIIHKQYDIYNSVVDFTHTQHNHKWYWAACRHSRRWFRSSDSQHSAFRT